MTYIRKYVTVLCKHGVLFLSSFVNMFIFSEQMSPHQLVILSDASFLVSKLQIHISLTLSIIWICVPYFGKHNSLCFLAVTSRKFVNLSASYILFDIFFFSLLISLFYCIFKLFPVNCLSEYQPQILHLGWGYLSRRYKVNHHPWCNS